MPNIGRQILRKRDYVGPTQQTEITEVKGSKRVVQIHRGVVLGDLAHKLSVKFKDLLDECLKLNLLIKETDYVGPKLAADISALFHNKKIIENKRVIGRINASVNLHQYNFYLFIANFFDKMEELFVKCKDTNFNNTYQDFIKTMIGGCYYEYLKTNSEILPFSLQTHADKYKLN